MYHAASLADFPFFAKKSLTGSSFIFFITSAVSSVPAA